MIEDRCLLMDEIAAYWGIKRDTVYVWIERRKMPAHKVTSYLQTRRNRYAI